MRRVLMVLAALATAGCTTVVTGRPVPDPNENLFGAAPFSAAELLLGVDRIRAITGGDESLNVIPTMDTEYPVDIEPLVETAPPECALVFAETEVFGRDYAAFHKTTYQYPPESGLISEAAAVYSDSDAAAAAFRTLSAHVYTCGATDYGATYLGEPTDGENTLRTRPAGDCGRDYRLESSALIEVTFCGFPDSVPEIVIANIVANVPG